MSIQLYDTQTRSLQALLPKAGEPFRFYCCGPTVYGPAHIGNFRTFLIQDTLRRILEVEGFSVQHVRNLTDLDDKTIRGAQKAGLALNKFTEQWTQKYLRGLQSVEIGMFFLCSLWYFNEWSTFTRYDIPKDLLFVLV